MLRSEITTESLHTADHFARTTHVWSVTVFGPANRMLALFCCTQMVLW